MWRAVTEFLLKMKASGLSHEATIEILIALLGLMLAVLALIAAFVAFAVAVAGVFGFQTIRDEAVKKAEKMAARTARQVANKVRKQIISEEQAIAMAASQESSEPELTIDVSQQSSVPRRQRRKATSDKNLKREESS